MQAEKLKQLENTVSETYHISGDPQAPNRGLLIDLGRFWEILEYSSASENSSLSGKIFGPSLYSGRSRHLTTEFSETSALPETTKVSNVTGSEESSVAQPNSDNLNIAFGGIAEVVGAVESTPMTYSNDELAVLAESFFNQGFQGQSDMRGVEDWEWNTGNL